MAEPFPQLNWVMMEDYRNYLRAERMLQRSTIKRYFRVLENCRDSHSREDGESPVSLSEFSEDSLVRFLRQQSASPEGPSRTLWNANLSALRSFFAFAVKRGHVMNNLALKIARQKTHAKEPVPLSLGEMIRLVEILEQAPSPYRERNVAMVQVLFHCALRVSELVSLNLEQVDLVNRVFLDVRTKGDKRLSAPFNDVTCEALEKYLQVRPHLVPDNGETALFLSDRKQRIRVRSVQALIERYSQKAGITRPVTPHLLRHSSATQLVNMGTPLAVVQAICGHASSLTTERYIHVNGGQRRKAIDELGKSWRQQAHG